MAAVPYEADLATLSLDQLRQLCRDCGLMRHEDERPHTKTCVQRLREWKDKQSGASRPEETKPAAVEPAQEPAACAAAAWTDDPSAPYPPAKAGGFTDKTLRAMSSDDGHGSILWNGEAFSRCKIPSRVL